MNDARWVTPSKSRAQSFIKTHRSGSTAVESPGYIRDAKSILRSFSHEKSKDNIKKQRYENLNITNNGVKHSSRGVSANALQEAEVVLKKKRKITHKNILKYLLSKEPSLQNFDEKSKIKIKLVEFANASMSSLREKLKYTAKDNEAGLTLSKLVEAKVSSFPDWLRNRGDFRNAVEERFIEEVNQQNNSDIRWNMFEQP
jgi:hypothetical protein